MYNECRHIFTSGKKCQSPALRDQNFCYFHQINRRPTPKDRPYEPYTPPQETILALSTLEDADAIQLALSDVVLALAANRIDSRRARILIYGLQVASQNNRHRCALAAIDTVPAIVSETHEHEDGTLIAPPKQTPAPEEIPEKRPPSLGEILLRQAEAMKAEQEAQAKANEDTGESCVPGIVDIQAAAEIRLPHSDSKDLTSSHSRTRNSARYSARSACFQRLKYTGTRQWNHPLKPKKA
jgi:hypothetical protein